jgi:putative hydrolase of the HAD superfamily
MSSLLQTAGTSRDGHTSEGLIAELTQWLWAEQPRRNLWRRPLPGMFELVADLRSHGVPVGIVSNSEGRLAELVEELGHTELFLVIADSGRLGFEKPDRRIFEHATDALQVAPEHLIHVGDSWPADIEGALGVGARAIWLASEQRALPGGVQRANDARSVARALSFWNIPLRPGLTEGG